MGPASGYERQETELCRVGSQDLPQHRGHQAVRGMGTRDMASADTEAEFVWRD